MGVKPAVGLLEREGRAGCQVKYDDILQLHWQSAELSACCHCVL